MALVAFRNTQYTLTQGYPNVDNIYDVVLDKMKQLGYTGVTKTTHVFGGKAGNVLVVYFLLIEGKTIGKLSSAAEMLPKAWQTLRLLKSSRRSV
jgi:hypothetical protein